PTKSEGSIARLTQLIHHQAEGERRSSHGNRRHGCELRLLHRWDLLSEAGAGGFGTGLVGRSRPLVHGAAGISPGRDVADEVSLAAKASRTREAVSITRVPIWGVDQWPDHGYQLLQSHH